MALARELEITTLITDHHLPGEVLPQADVIVNPNQSRVLVLFGRYVGSVRTEGFFWTNPFTVKNTISLRDDPDKVGEKLKKMPTDPARVKRHDPGNPDVCPVWQFHAVYSNAETQAWARAGCATAGIGCIECKQPVIEAVQAELRPMQERAKEFIDNPDIVRNVIDDGVEQARATARETMDEVRRAMGLRYR